MNPPRLASSVWTGQSPYTYLWSNGETTQVINLLVNGTYWCVITDVGGCVNDTLYYEVTIIINVINELENTDSKLLKITDVLGREIPYRKRTPLFYIYDDGTVKKRIVIE